MSYHIMYSHECAGCGAYYIPYDVQIPCPRCGLVEAERFDYIAEAVAAMRIHKSDYGRYTPGAFFVGTLGDHVLYMLFGVFDAFESPGQGKAFGLFVEENLASCDWGDQDYLRAHIRDIALRLHESLSETGLFT